MRPAAVTLVYLAAVAGGAYLAFRPTFESGFDRVQAEAADGLLNHYLLEHSWQVVSDPDYRGSLLSPPFFHPQPLVLAYSENLLGAAPVYWALRLALPHDLAYPWWMIACGVLNFAAFAAAARWVGCNHLLAALGGFLWAFALVHVYQARHQQMIPRFWMPLAAYHAWALATAPNLRSLNRCLACVFLQVAACVNTGWFLGVGVATFVPVAAAARPGGWRELAGFVRANRFAVLGVLGLWGLLTVGFLAPYFVANRGFAREYAECVDMLPTLAGWLTGPPGSCWYDTLRPRLRPVYEDCFLFSGFGLVALFGAAAAHAWVTRDRPNRDPAFVFVAACMVTAGVWFLLTLNYGDNVSPWRWVRLLPGGRAIRCVSRVDVVIYLFATLGALVWLTRVMDRVRDARVRAAVLLAVVGAITFEQTGYDPPAVARADFYPAADRCAAGLRGAEVGYVVPRFGRHQADGDLLGMWAGLRANVPVVNGYSGRYPDGYTVGAEGEPDEQLRAWLAGRFRGRVAVVDPAEPDRVRDVLVE